MPAPHPLPEGLATLPPGPELAAALASVDPPKVSGYDSVELGRATRRQENAARAATLAAVVNIALRKPGHRDTVAFLQIPHDHAVDEIAAAYSLSPTAAGKLLALAWSTVKRLPQLHAAMDSGQLDETRAWVFAEWTELLADEHANAVCDALLPQALLDAEEPLPTGPLIGELKKMAIALDPTWAERLYKESLRKRKVRGKANRDGTADIYAQQQELHRVATAMGRLNALARTAKADGDPRPIDHLRSDLCMGMLDGTYEGLTDAQISEALAATRPVDEEIVVNTGGWTRTPVPYGDPGSAPEESAPAASEQPQPAPAPAPAPPTPSPRPTPARVPQSSHKGLHLKMRMTSLLGLDRAPAELAGWAPIHGAYGQMLTSLMGRAQWRFAITDDDGHFLSSGLITARPAGFERRDAANSGIVDLLVPASLLRDLIIGPIDGLELVDPVRFQRWLPVLQELADHLLNPKPMPDDSDRRTPGAALRRAIELDRSRCIGVGCNRSARTCDMDHRRDWAKAGAPRTRTSTLPADATTPSRPKAAGPCTAGSATATAGAHPSAANTPPPCPASSGTHPPQQHPTCGGTNPNPTSTATSTLMACPGRNPGCGTRRNRHHRHRHR